jgi:hypothetical protein
MALEDDCRRIGQDLKCINPPQSDYRSKDVRNKGKARWIMVGVLGSEFEEADKRPVE